MEEEVEELAEERRETAEDTGEEQASAGQVGLTAEEGGVEEDEPEELAEDVRERSSEGGRGVAASLARPLYFRLDATGSPKRR